MHRVDNDTSIGTLPTPSVVGPNPDSFFTRGDPENAIPATVVDDDWANAIQEEICNVIEGAGIVLDKTSTTQLKTAINTINQTGYYASTSGTDTYTASLSPVIASYTTNMLVRIKFVNANTGAATLNLNSIGAKSIKLPNGNALFAGDIPANHLGLLWYDGTNMVLLNPDQITAKIGRKGTDIASASTTNLATATADFVDVTGTTTITAFGSAPAAGLTRVVRFTGALTLTHNGTSLILPGGVNYTTASNDMAIFRALDTSGNWICVAYIRASGGNVLTGVKGADIASAGTTDLSAATGDYVEITGTTTITAFGTITAGIQRTVRFTGALTLTHNATSLILPGGANITTASGDTAIFRSLGSGNWICVSYKKADGKSVIPTNIAAVQADQETATSTTTFVSPGTQQYHPSAAKCWCSYKTTTSTSIYNSYNITSLTDNGAGNTTITIATDFSAANMCFTASSYDNGAGVGSLALFLSTIAAGAVQLLSVTPTTLVAADSAYVTMVGFGDQ